MGNPIMSFVDILWEAAEEIRLEAEALESASEKGGSTENLVPLVSDKLDAISLTVTELDFVTEYSAVRSMIAEAWQCLHEAEWMLGCYAMRSHERMRQCRGLLRNMSWYKTELSLYIKVLLYEESKNHSAEQGREEEKQ